MMITSSIRSFASMTPKVTSKKTKQRRFLMPGIPTHKLTARQARDPFQNHVLMANKQSSKRERHFRRVLAQSNCVGWAHDPDLSGDMHPYWLKKQEPDLASAFANSDNKPKIFNDPVIQTAAAPRLVRAFAASNDAQKLKQFIHRGLVKPSDISQIAESRTRAQQNIPLFDRVLLKCEEEIKNSVLLDRNTNESKQIVNEDLSFMDNSHLVVIHKEKGENIALQHGVNSRDLNLIIGSPQTILKNSSTFNENQQEVSSEDSNEEQENSSQKFDNNGIVPDMITRNIMKKIIGLSTANRRELNSYILHKVIECFRRHETDYGSPQVSAAVLTFKIRNLACHVYTFPQDTQSRKSLDEMTHKRRKIFEYMKRVDFGNYMKLVSDLGLKVA